MLTAFYVLWCAGPVLDLAAACRMARNGLIQQYRLVVFYLLISVLRSALLVASWRHQESYHRLFDSTLPVALMAQALAILATFWVVVENYPKFRGIGAVALAVLIAFGIAITWATRNIGMAQSYSRREGVLLMERHSLLIMVSLVIGVAVLLPKFSEIPIRKSATRVATILGLDAGCYFIIAAIGLATTAYVARLQVNPRFVITFIPFIVRIGIGLLWLLWPTPQSHVAGKPQPVTDADRWELLMIRHRLRQSGLI
jgi:hypothetical protein